MKKPRLKSQAARDLEGWIDALQKGGEQQVVEVREHARLDVEARTIREAQGLSRQEFASRYGLSLRTVENWEDGRREPEGPAKSLLIAIAFAPEAVAQAMSDYRAGKSPGQPGATIGHGVSEFESAPDKEFAVEFGANGTQRVTSSDIRRDIRKAVKEAIESALSAPSSRRASKLVRPQPKDMKA